MGYRDETETLRARLAEAEVELEAARATIGRLTGLTPAAATGHVEERSAVTGAPRRLALERALDFEVTDEGLEAIAALIRPRAGLAAVAQVGRTLTAPGFSLETRDGVTRVAMSEAWPHGSIALVGGGLGGAFAAVATTAVIHDAGGGEQAVVHLAWLAPLFIALLFFVLRGRAASVSRAGSQALRGTFEAVVELAHRHRVRERPAVRVAVDDADAEELEDELADAARPAEREA